jgi:signal transduction histidine kinase/HD-like signal output (HDOD) protein/CheY-like chemotaxis protein
MAYAPVPSPSRTGSNVNRAFRDDLSAYPSETPSQIKGLLKHIEEMPSLPGVAVRAIEMIMQEDVDTADLARVIESDPALTLKILKLVNAAANSLVRQVSSMQQAIALLGMTTVRCSILGVFIRDLMPQSTEETAKHFDEVWAHSLGCAVAAQLIAEKTYPSLKYEAFIAALLHDIGKIFIIEYLPERYVQIKKYMESNRVSSLVAEQEILGTDHTRIGKWIAERWNLPGKLVRGIWMHHNPIDSLPFLHVEHELLYILVLANRLAREHFSDQYEADAEQDKILKLIALERGDLDEIRSRFSGQYAERAKLFALDGDLDSIYFQSLSKANRRLSSLALELDKQNRSLSHVNSISRMNNELALKISTSATVQETFQCLAETYRKFDLFHVGIIYVIDLNQRLMEGIIWSQDKTMRMICFLNKDGTPVWDHQSQRVPKGLKNLIETYGERIRENGNGVDPRLLCYKPPFCLIPLYSGRNLHGEICLAMTSAESELSEEQRLGMIHSANLTAACIRKIQVTETLEKRSEDLNLALWKNQQINLKLLQTQRLAAVGQLAAGAAHEINNPLAIINARAQLLQRRETDEKKQRELKQITEQIERISGILTDLMTFARPAPPKLTLVDVKSLLDRVLELVSTGMEKLNITIYKEYAKDIPAIKADQNQLEQVFLNLIINAQHAMEETGGLLEVKASVSPDRQTLHISIADQGKGIPKEHLSRIFDPFFTTKEEGKGTGLGLSTSKVIVDNHFGQIDFQSTVGKGTTVHLKIPVDLDSLKKSSRNDGEPAPTGTLFGNPRILVVDDEEHIREILKETLEAERMTVTTASNGEEALAILEKGNFDLMLLDIRMPRRSGLSLLNSIHERKEGLPVIIISAMATHEEMQEAIDLGAAKCIRKPFHIKTLLKDIHDVLAPVRT